MRVHRIFVYTASHKKPGETDLSRITRPLTCDQCIYCYEDIKLVEMLGRCVQRVCTYPFKRHEHQKGNDCLGRALDLDGYKEAFNLFRNSNGYDSLAYICDKYELDEETQIEIEEGYTKVAGDDIIEIPSVDSILTTYYKAKRALLREERNTRELVSIALEGFKPPDRAPGVPIAERPHMKEILARLTPIVGKSRPSHIAEACQFLRASERKWLRENLEMAQIE